MAVAVAEEKLLATHIDRALEMIARVGDDVPFDDVLEIYTRLLRLSSDESRVLKTRALAALGQRTGGSPWPEAVDPGTRAPADTGDDDAAADEDDEDEDDDDDDRASSLFGQIRRRFRGRINEDLRFVIELEAARAEEALLYRHIANALQFVGLLDGEMAPSEAIDLYIDALDVRESMSEVVYHLTLSRLADRRFGDASADRPVRVDREAATPAAGAAADAAGDGDDSPSTGAQSPLRVVEPDGGA